VKQRDVNREEVLVLVEELEVGPDQGPKALGEGPPLLQDRGQPGQELVEDQVPGVFEERVPVAEVEVERALGHPASSAMACIEAPLRPWRAMAWRAAARIVSRRNRSTSARFVVLTTLPEPLVIPLTERS
jgi:hypothetical protein